MSRDQTDRNLLFGVLALQAGLIDQQQFAEACAAWAARRSTPLADVLAERGWLSDDDRSHVDYLVQRTVTKHAGNAHASLAAVAGDNAVHALATLDSPAVRESLTGIAPRREPAAGATTAFVPTSRERYTLTRLHATGGIGQVWLARDENLTREIAFKELKPEQAEIAAARSRFIHEAQITGQLQHPGIVPVYELTQQPSEGSPFYTMRFIKGRTLTQEIGAFHERRVRGESGPRDLIALLNRFIAVCNAVAYAHARGVIHRDLKGQNVALGDVGEVIVLDWGLAKVIDQPEKSIDMPPVRLQSPGHATATMDGQVLGTPAYMSTEQAAGRLDLLDCRTDVYGLGAMLYEILTGQPPFDGTDTPDVLRRVREEAPPRPRQIVSSVPPALEAICLRAMAKNPADRYASARDVADEVQRWLADEPVTAYAEPLRARLRRWSRRHRTLVTGTAAALVVAVFSLSAAALLLNAARTQAQEQRAQADANFQLARQAVDDYITKVSQDPRLKEHDLEDLRKNLLASSLTFYEQFVAQRGDDPAVRAEHARALTRMASIHGAIGHTDAAVEQYQQALAIQEPLVRDFPQQHVYRFDLVKSLQSLYELRGKYDQQEAPQTLARIRDLITELATQHPQNSEYQLFHAGFHIAFGEYFKNNNRGADANAEYQKALHLYEELSKAHPENSEYQGGRGVTCWLLGMRQVEQKEYPEGERLLKQAEAILDPLVREHPSDLEQQGILAMTHWSLGLLYHQLDRTAESEQEFEKSLDIFARRARAHPSITEYQHLWAVNLLTRGMAYANAGKDAKAIALLQPSIETLEKLVHDHPQRDMYKSNLQSGLKLLSLIYRTSHRADEAETVHPKLVALQERLAQEHPQQPNYRFELAAMQNSLGLWYKEIGRTDKAEAAHRRSLQVFAALLADSPDVLDYAVENAGVHCNLGHLCSDGPNIRAALEQYAQADAALSNVLKRDSGHTRAREYLGNTLKGRIALYIGLGRKADALAERQRLVKLFDEQVTLTPDDADALDALARAQQKLGELYEELERPADAAATYQQSLLVQEKLIKAHPNVARYAIDLGGVYCNKAHAASKQHPQQAREWYDRAETILRGVVQSDIKPASYRNTAVRNLRNTFTGRALLLTATGRPADAVRDAREGVALQESLLRSTRDDDKEKAYLGECLYWLSDAHRRAGDLPAAEKAYRDSLRAIESTYRLSPETVAAAVKVGGSQCNFGQFLRAAAKPQEALDWFDKALVTLQTALHHDPGNSQAARFLKNTRLERTKALLGVERLAEAETEYRTAVAFAERQMNDTPAQPARRRDLARLHSDFADEYRQAKKPAEAEAAYQKSASILRELSRQFPNNVEYAGELADALTNSAKAYGFAGQWAPALERFEKAVAYREQLANEHPDNTSFARGLAELYDLVALVNAAATKYETAQQTAERGVTAWERLVRQHPDADDIRLSHVKSLQQLGLFSFLNKKSDRAAQAYEQAGAGWEHLAKSMSPGDFGQHRDSMEECYAHLGELYLRNAKWAAAETAYRRSVASANDALTGRAPPLKATTLLGGKFCNLGLVLLAQEKYHEALPWFYHAIRVLEEVCRQAPQDASAKEFQRNALRGQARTLSKLDRHAEALAAWDRALAVADDKSRTDLRLGRAVALARAGEPDRAVADAAKVAALPSLTASDHYNLACVYAVAVAALQRDAKLSGEDRAKKTEEFAKQALHFLARAADADYFKDATDLDALKADKDLDSIRTREEFKSLQKRLPTANVNKEK